MTRPQAFEILGLTQNQLLTNVKIQELLTQHVESPLRVNSLVERNSGQVGDASEMIKVHNFQALIDDNYSLYPDNDQSDRTVKKSTSSKKYKQ